MTLPRKLRVELAIPMSNQAVVVIYQLKPQPMKRRGNNYSQSREEVSSEFNDSNIQDSPLRLPSIKHQKNQSSTPPLKLKAKDQGLPRIKEQHSDLQNSLDGSEDFDQPDNYANSSDNIQQHLKEIRRRLNLSKYSEKMIVDEKEDIVLKERHSGSSSVLRQMSRDDILEKEERGRGKEQRLKTMEEINIEYERTLVTETNKADSDISDFEQKVEANKAMIKKEVHKRKRDKTTLKTQKNNQKKPNNQMLYEKRAKQYKESSENRYLQMKKREVALTQLKIRQRQQDMKSRHKEQSRMATTPPEKVGEGSPVIRYNVVRKTQDVPLRRGESIVKKRKSKLKENILDESPPPPQNKDLFDDINDILKSKHKVKSGFLPADKLKSLSLQTSTKPKKINFKDLEKSFRILEEHENRLAGSTRDPESLKVTMDTLLPSANILQWHRISISSSRKDLSMVPSNFANEVDRINSYHTKNQMSLQSYICNKGLLIELEIHERLKEGEERLRLLEVKQQKRRDGEAS